MSENFPVFEAANESVKRKKNAKNSTANKYFTDIPTAVLNHWTMFLLL